MKMYCFLNFDTDEKHAFASHFVGQHAAELVAEGCASQQHKHVHTCVHPCGERVKARLMRQELIKLTLLKCTRPMSSDP